MNKFGSDFWARVAEVVSFTVVAASFMGEKTLGKFYIPFLSSGIIFIIFCLILMFYKEFKRK